MEELTIQLPSAVVRDALAALHHRMVDAIAAPAITVDASQVVATDTAGLQLLCALAQTVAARGARMRWRGVGSQLRRAAAELGLAAALAFPEEA